jgi:hypothetical protein
MICNPDDPAPSPSCESGALTDPELDYDNSAQDCAVIGGYVYRGALSDYVGQYFFADACSGGVWSLDRGTGQVANRSVDLAAVVPGGVRVVAIGEGGTGELYLVGENGTVYKLRSALPECSDGVDNDADGKADFPEDTGCQSATSLSENPICDDGIDNDGEGDIDTLDPDCGAAWENVEATAERVGLLREESLCGLGAELALLLPMLVRLHARRRRARAAAAAAA